MKIPSRLPRHTAVFLLLFPLSQAGSLQAQLGVEAARQASLQSAPSLSLPDQGAGEVVPPSVTVPRMEGDAEYGVQKILYRRSNIEPFNVAFDLGYYYTDNVALLPDGEQDDSFFRSGLRASYTPQLKGGLFFSTSAGSEVYRYTDSDLFDFDLLSFDIGLLYATPQQGTIFDPIFGNMVGYLRYGYYSLSEPWEWSDSTFENQSIIAGLLKTWKISRGHQVYAGVNADWSIDASQPLPQRDEYSAFLGYRVKWTADLESNVLYRAALNEYKEIDRSDVNQILSLGLTYYFNDWVSATGSISAVFNNSDRAAFDYNALNGGISVALQAKW